MKKIIYSILLITNISFAQDIENDAQELLNIFLDQSKLTLNDYVIKNDFKSLYVLLNNSEGYSKIDFDTKGNIISYLYNGGNPIKKLDTEYDENNKVIRMKYFNLQDKLVNETHNIYKNDTILTYSSKDDSLLELKTQSKMVDLNEIYEKNNMIISLRKDFDENGNLLKETLIQDKKTKSKQYESVENEKYVTITEKDSLGNIEFTKKYLIEKRNKISNKIEYYNDKSELPYRIDTFDSNGLISELYFDVSENKFKEIIYKKNENGILNRMELINYSTNNKSFYNFKTNNKGWLTDISKDKKVNYNFKFILKE
jgi:hypothetical protein